MALFTVKLPSLGALSTRERGILALALIVAGVFFVTRGLPLVQEAYAARADSIDSVLLDIERERRLLNTEASWEQKRRETEAKLAAAEAGLFRGTTAATVEASIQRELSQYAANAGITVNSTRLAERLPAGEWTLISQELSFETSDAAATVKFLKLIETSVPQLKVSAFSLDRSRNQFSGSLTAVGFARLNRQGQGSEGGLSR